MDAILQFLNQFCQNQINDLHLRQAVFLSFGNSPAPQNEQKTAPPFETEPGPHIVHSSAPPVEKVVLGQASCSVLFALDLFPAPALRQNDAPAAENSPTFSHLALVPPLHANPGGQVAHPSEKGSKNEPWPQLVQLELPWDTEPSHSSQALAAPM